MPNRIVRDWTDSLAIDGLGDQAEVFFTRVIMKADDYGRFSANPKLLRSLCFPLRTSVRENDIIRWLAACYKAGLVRLYVAEGKPVLQVERFGQQVRSRSKYPDPVPITCVADAEQLNTLVGGVVVSVVGGVVVTPPALPPPRATPENKGKATHADLLTYCQEVGLLSTDADFLFHKWDGNGWTNSGKAILDWKATVRSWKSAGYMPSQKQQQQNGHHKPAPAIRIVP